VLSVSTSLRRKEPELGDSDGGRSRIEAVNGNRVLVSLNTCEMGLSVEDGSEWERLGMIVVGGSYLAHITNTLYFITGTTTPLKTSVNRRIPLPLLVEPSGNTATGLSARRRISSRL